MTNSLLTPGFLKPYYDRGDSFTSLLARSTYLTKYCRNSETWTDTIKRVVDGSMQLDPNSQVSEAEALFDAFWTMRVLPPGRGLWVGGVPGMPEAAKYNCWCVPLRTIDDWCWTADMLMHGGGVGITLNSDDDLGQVLPGSHLGIWCDATHPNTDECTPLYIDSNRPCRKLRVPDTRQGWVEAIRLVLKSAYNGIAVSIDVSDIRPRGAPIKTFGGIACGPGPLVNLLKSIHEIVTRRAGKYLTGTDKLDITNFIGLCIKSGNVRRSALIVLGEVDDLEFRTAKRDWEAVKSHRHTSNNSIAFEYAAQLEQFDWSGLVDEMATYGEPGIVNLAKMRETDPAVVGTNPCGEIPLHVREACNLAEVFPAKGATDDDFKLATRYALRQRIPALEDPESDLVRRNNMRLGIGIGGICDFEANPAQLRHWYNTVRSEATTYAYELNVNAPNFVTTVKPSGTISLLNDSSPGMHAPFAPFYIRRTRISKQDPMAAAMIAAGVPYEDCVYDKTGNTHVFSFPVAKSHATAYVQDETVHQQFQRQFMLQTSWADNAVSVTISFDESEKAELAECLRVYAPHLKSISCLPKAHGYAQPPYEACSQQVYEDMYELIDHSAKLVHGGEIEIDECATGACPVR